MERALKSQDLSSAVASPKAGGWKLCWSDGSEESYPALEQLAEALPEAINLHLALPVSAVLLHRMVLPTTEREELASMAQLQLEKTLPFGSEEITTDLSLIKQTEGASTVLSFCVRNAELESLCAPLIARGIHPRRLSVLAADLVSEIVSREVACALLVYAEGDGVAFAISEAGRPSYAGLTSKQKDSEAGRGGLMAQLPAAFLAAELEGVPTEFTRLYIQEACSELAPTLETFIGIKAELFARSGSSAQPCDYNLVPSLWEEARKAKERLSKIKQRLKQAAMAYVLLILAALGFLLSGQVRLSRLEKRLVEIRPAVDSIAELKASWARFAPAVDPERFTVELLLQVYNCLPSQEVRLTKFTCNLEQLILEGEAPTAGLAIEFGEQLKKNASLGRFNLEAGPPVLLPNEHAQFRIFGKL